jgi:flagellar biogenesis protein FliO
MDLLTALLAIAAMALAAVWSIRRQIRLKREREARTIYLVSTRGRRRPPSVRPSRRR